MVYSMSGKECLESAKHALSLLNGGSLSKASTALAKVRREANRLQIDAEEYAKRLEDLEPWIQRYQEKYQRQIGKVEQQQWDLRERENQLRVETAQVRANISHYDDLIEKKERDMEAAENAKSSAVGGAVAVGVMGVIFAPFTFGTSLIPAAAGTTALVLKASDLDDEISDSRKEIRRLQSKIDDLESEMRSIDSKKQQCQQHMASFKTQQQHMYEQLRELKQAVALLMKSVRFWKELAAATENFDQSGQSLKRLVDRAVKTSDLSLIQRSGSQTRLRRFNDSWSDVSDRVRDTGEIVITYCFVCIHCNQEKRGLPWAINTSNVICDDCHSHLNY